MKKRFVQLYALGCYALGLTATALYADFLGGGYVISRIDARSAVALPDALLTNGLLIVVFGLQHSLMARNGFKRWLGKIVSPRLERSTYVGCTAAALGLVIWGWLPLPEVIFDLQGTLAGGVLWAMYGMGWLVCLLSTFFIDHFDLLGIRQAFCYGRGEADGNAAFRTPALYKIIRHPVYLGWLLIHWCTPHLTVGRMLLVAGMTLYLFIGMHYEEDDLVKEFGEEYQSYRRRKPRIIPSFFKPTNKTEDETVAA